MCLPIIPIIGASLGAIGAGANIMAQNAAADAHNRGLEVQMQQQRTAEADMNLQLRNQQQAINENGVAARFQRSREHLVEMGRIKAQNAFIGISGDSRQGAVHSAKAGLDLSIMRANQESQLINTQQKITSNRINTQAQVEATQSRQQFGVSPLTAGLQILSGGFSGAATGASF